MPVPSWRLNTSLPARTAVAGSLYRSFLVAPLRAAKASVWSTTDAFSLLQTARSAGQSFSVAPWEEQWKTPARKLPGKTCFSFLMSCLHMLSLTTANLHVLTPMRITTRFTSLFLVMLASQWLTSSMARPETLRFWLWSPGNSRSGLMGRATESPIRTLVAPGATLSSARR